MTHEVLLALWLGGAFAQSLGRLAVLDMARLFKSLTKPLTEPLKGPALGVGFYIGAFGTLVVLPLIWPIRIPWRLVRTLRHGAPDADREDVLAAAFTWHRMQRLGTYDLAGERGELVRRATAHLIETLDAIDRSMPPPDIRQVSIRLPAGAAIPARLGYYDVVSGLTTEDRCFGVYVPQAMDRYELEFVETELRDLADTLAGTRKKLEEKVA